MMRSSRLCCCTPVSCTVVTPPPLSTLISLRLALREMRPGILFIMCAPSGARITVAYISQESRA